MTSRPSVETQVVQRQTRVFDTLRTRVMANHTLHEYERRSALWFTTLFQQKLDAEKRIFGNARPETLASHFQSKRLVPARSVDAGQMYFFSYAPKHHQHLKTFDRFPFVLVLDTNADGFLGINFHYLPYRERAILFDALTTHRDVQQESLDTEIRIDYDTLQKSSKYFGYAACMHRYLYSSCRSRLLQVGETEWDLALFLPVAMFQKQTQGQVWKWSQHRNVQQRRQMSRR